MMTLKLVGQILQSRVLERLIFGETKLLINKTLERSNLGQDIILLEFVSPNLKTNHSLEILHFGLAELTKCFYCKKTNNTHSRRSEKA